VEGDKNYIRGFSSQEMKPLFTAELKLEQSQTGAKKDCPPIASGFIGLVSGCDS
jgi:hypothetical protein